MPNLPTIPSFWPILLNSIWLFMQSFWSQIILNSALPKHWFRRRNGRRLCLNSIRNFWLELLLKFWIFLGRIGKESDPWNRKDSLKMTVEWSFSKGIPIVWTLSPLEIRRQNKLDSSHSSANYINLIKYIRILLSGFNVFINFLPKGIFIFICLFPIFVQFWPQ